MIIWEKIDDLTIKAAGYPIYIKRKRGLFVVISDWHQRTCEVHELYSAKCMSEKFVIEIDEFIPNYLN